MKTQRTSLKRFQNDAVNNAKDILGRALTLVEKCRGTIKEQASRHTAISNYGYVLFEAPTGIGKTLMTGTTVEELSLKHKVIWFWFAPFKGVINQTINAIKDEHNGLRPKKPQLDRLSEDLRSGDVFVCTWASLAVDNADTREARKSTETLDSIDRLIDYARANRFSIGVVIDEAHHSFKQQSQAYKFYREVLNPEVTLMATATPNDRDIEKFKDENRIEHLHRITISRRQGVDAGLLKRGVKVGVFKADHGYEKFVDLRLAAFRYGLQTHYKITGQLRDNGLSLTPLLLIQVDSTATSKLVQHWLKEEKFSERQVVVHTSDEPDPNLLAVAADERVQILIFKMAIGTGFDVPRAFTLVSMRTTVDPNWGIQIVGRIMRVHRQLQGKKDLPMSLQNGYVFMSNHQGQQGLTEAAHKINSLKDELSTVSDHVAIVEVGQDGLSIQETVNGQTTLLPDVPVFKEKGEDSAGSAKGHSGSATSTEQGGFEGIPSADEFSLSMNSTLEQMEVVPKPKGKERLPSGKGVADDENDDASALQPAKYQLRTDICYPTEFFTAVTSPDESNRIVDDVVAELRLSEVFPITMREKVTVNVSQTEIFAGKVEAPDQFSVKLTDSALAKNAQRSFNLADSDGYIDYRKLRKKLEQALKAEYDANGISAGDDPREVRSGVNRLLALAPERVKQAVRKVINRHTTIKKASPIPGYIESDYALKPSRLNVYEVLPADLGSWEVPFAEMLDEDSSGTILWWHRNPDRKPYSVAIPVPGHNNYYPDFIVGVKDRTIGEGLLLVETKERYTDELAEAKTQVSHPSYKKPMMLYWKNLKEWHTVEFDEDKGKNVLDRIYRISIMKTYS